MTIEVKDSGRFEKTLTGFVSICLVFGSEITLEQLDSRSLAIHIYPNWSFCLPIDFSPRHFQRNLVFGVLVDRSYDRFAIAFVLALCSIVNRKNQIPRPMYMFSIVITVKRSYFEVQTE